MTTEIILPNNNNNNYDTLRNRNKNIILSELESQCDNIVFGLDVNRNKNDVVYTKEQVINNIDNILTEFENKIGLSISVLPTPTKGNDIRFVLVPTSKSA